jgi:hypothetical protein
VKKDTYFAMAGSPSARRILVCTGLNLAVQQCGTQANNAHW